MSGLSFAVDLKEQTDTFDKFLNNKLKASDVSILKSTCQISENFSPFCYSIINKELLEQKLKQLKLSKYPPKIKYKATTAKLKQGKIENWMQMRFASVQSLIKGISRIKPFEINKVHAEALKEQGCPNNAAIATAAVLEDQLPNSSKLEDLADLYEKGKIGRAHV